MIDQFNDDYTGWAQFSDELNAHGEPLMRYHLVRKVSDRTRGTAGLLGGIAELAGRGELVASAWDITVFLLCNPSDANAFKPDPTVTECVKFTRRWDSDITWVVNLWALRSPYPTDLRKRAIGFRGDDEQNDKAIMVACRAATRVIAAWGAAGALDHRAAKVCHMLSLYKIKLHHLGLTQEGYPKHPLARGKHRIPPDTQPTVWTP